MKGSSYIPIREKISARKAKEERGEGRGGEKVKSDSQDCLSLFKLLNFAF